MKITLKKIAIENFKGVQKASYEFSNHTQVTGKNESGKTTIYDAFLWCLFGKDSTESKAFSIKPIRDGVITSRLDNTVHVAMDVDGMEIDIKRTQREKWVTQRGEETPEFKGNETLLEWNGVPMNLSQFKDRINELCPEETFKLITNA